MNKIELIQTLSDVIRNNPGKEICLLLLTEDKIITGYPVFDDADLPSDNYGMASDVRQALKPSESKSGHLVANTDGILLRTVGIRYHGENPFGANSLFVFYDAIIGASIFP